MMFASRSLTALMVYCFLLTFLVAPGHTAQRKVLFEEFTNNGCGPCAAVAPFVHDIMVDYDQVLVPVVWHTWWPNPSDPLYLHNPAPINRRVYRYGINGVPMLFLDGEEHGIVMPPNTYPYLAGFIDSRMAVSSPLSIDIVVQVTAEGILAMMNVTVETPTFGNHRLYVALTERHIELPGPNGQTDHYWTFRRINNNDATESGQPIDLCTPGVQHFVFDAEDFPMDPNYEPTELAICAWVQDVDTFEVIQAGKGNAPCVPAIEYASLHTRIGASDEVVHYAATLQQWGFGDEIFDVTIDNIPSGWACSYTTPEGTFSGPSSLPLPNGASVPIAVDLDSQGHPGPATITLTCTARTDPPVSVSLDFHKINGVDVLVVDDDGGAAREERCSAYLDGAGVSWRLWEREWGDLDREDLEAAADVIVWLTGDHVPTLTESDRSAISGWLDSGGRLLLTGQEIAYDLADPLSPNFSPETIVWFVTTLHAIYQNTCASIYYLDGVPGDLIGDGLAFSLDPGGPYGQTTMDTITPGFDASGVCTYQGVPNWFGGIRWTNGSARLVYLCVGVEGVSEASQRELLLSRILGWFGCSAGVDVAETSKVPFAILGSEPNPASSATAIHYRLDTGGSVRLRIFDVSGRLVRTLFAGQQSAAEHRLPWDGRDDAGLDVASGVYFYRLEAAGENATNRLVIVR